MEIYAFTGEFYEINLYRRTHGNHAQRMWIHDAAVVSQRSSEEIELI
jgi:hypothetical protein